MEHEINQWISDLVNGFKQLPYLFIGTGFSIRYSTAPSWDKLLMNIWKMLNDNDETRYKKFVNGVAYRLNINDMTDEEKKYNLNPQLATEIQQQFNEIYFTNDEFEKKVFTDEEAKDVVENNYDPFKSYVAKITKELSICNNEIKPEVKEIDYLKENQNKIGGIITTNYDVILEDIFKDFDVIVGQDNLLTSNANSIFEIFKIHGSCKEPSSIIITKEDYGYFKNKLKYLSAKLLTIFVEHPIIFIGYSIGDLNIRYILKEIAECLNKEQLEKIKDNFIFINPAFGEKEEIKLKEIDFGDKKIIMTEVKLEDFSVLYKALATIRSTMPVKLMRKMQDMVTEYVYSTTATNSVIFGSINSPDIDDDKTAIYVGSMDSISQIGFNTFEIVDILEDILFNNKPFLVNPKLITDTFKNIRSKGGSTYLPIYKYIKALNIGMDEIPSNYLIIKSYDDVKPNSAEKKLVNDEKCFNNIKEIINYYPEHLPKQFANIKNIASKINADELGDYLKEAFRSGRYFEKGRVSTFKKLTALYDYLKYGKQ